jgi:hypothetical protein
MIPLLISFILSYPHIIWAGIPNPSVFISTSLMIFTKAPLMAYTLYFPSPVQPKRHAPIHTSYRKRTYVSSAKEKRGKSKTQKMANTFFDKRYHSNRTPYTNPIPNCEIPCLCSNTHLSYQIPRSLVKSIGTKEKWSKRIGSDPILLHLSRIQRPRRTRITSHWYANWTPQGITP